MRKNKKRIISGVLVLLLSAVQVCPVSASGFQDTKLQDSLVSVENMDGMEQDDEKTIATDENTETPSEEQGDTISESNVQNDTDSILNSEKEETAEKEDGSSEEDIQTQEEDTESIKNDSAAQEDDEKKTEDSSKRNHENTIPGVSYQITFQNYGESNLAADGAVSGKAGSGWKTEGITAELYRKEGEEGLSGGIRYRVYLENSGWQDWRKDGSYAGTSKNDIQIEALQMELTGEVAQQYDVYYKVYTQQIGWLGWAKNGQSAGTADFRWALEAIRVCLVKKGDEAPGKNEGAFIKGVVSSSLTATAHIQNDGDRMFTGYGNLIGTTGEKKRMEGIRLKIQGTGRNDCPAGGIRYRVHVQNLGWQNWTENGKLAGTTGKSLRMEAIQIELTGDLANYYDIYYSVHVQQLGWLGWAKNGEFAGTEAFSYRMEAMKIYLVPKGQPAPGTNEHAFFKGYGNTGLRYSGHIQNIGNLSEVTGNQILGTVGKGLRMEALKIQLSKSWIDGISGGIRYRAHVQNLGWMGWQQNGGMAGTSGRSLRMEAVEINLTGEIAGYYDIYYRVHVQNFGWLGWAKNGQSAGTTGYSYRLEAIQIQLIPKGGATPTNSGYYKQYTGRKTLNVPMTYQNPGYPNGCEAISLYMALRYYGYMLTTNDICYKYLPRGPLHSTNPYSAYMGDPGSLTGGYGCWASVICQCATNYFKAVNVKNRSAKNITGSSLEDLFRYVENGTPVVVWGTLNMGSTTWFRAGSKNGVTFYWPTRAHCVLLTGYDKNRKVVKVNDPIRGKVEYSFSSFERAYKTMNRNAMVIQ